MKVHKQWKKKLTRDYSSWAIYIGLLLTGLVEILKEYGSQWMSEQQYSLVMTIVLFATLAVKLIPQSTPQSDNDEGDRDDSSDER